MPEKLTWRELLSICGKLVGHYPMAGCLCVACSYVKRRAEGGRCDDYVGEEAASMLAEVIARVGREDPVRGQWLVPTGSAGVVWCDASSIATGVLLEIGGVVAEDAAWLKKKDDYGHINIAELEAVVRGVNLALKWGLREIEVVTDSATVCEWVRLMLSEEKRIKTKGAAEILVKRRIGVLKDPIEDLQLGLTITLVPSERNKAAVLTRVKKSWLSAGKEGEENGVCAGAVSLREMHEMHHLGVDRSLYLARKVDPMVTRQSVQRVVKGCERCQRIDPAPMVHEGGEIWVTGNWRRLTVDVTHYQGAAYLSVVDCWPGQVAIWKQLKRESADEIASILNKIFLERGPVEELLMDNATVFRSELLKRALDNWSVRRFFRAAYHPSGNGIVERHHRTIKAMAERGSISPMEAVFWYNMSPRAGQAENSLPPRAMFRYEWRHPTVQPELKDHGKETTVEVGEEVWVKPANARCTALWQKGVVTAINSRNNVSVDGMPRHILDIRRVVLVIEASDDEHENQEAVRAEAERRYPDRGRRPPRWLGDYVTDSDFDE